jgi:hypothetical protein
MMKKFFAAANTEMGFRSLFDEIFAPEKFRRIYILKGGPGTGKSTLMRNLGAVAEGEGYDVEYICCSSDPDSLDGIIIPGLFVAVLDGTAPHATDPVYPGAVERIVDLGVALDFDLLEENRDLLIPLIRAKKEAYRSAYRFLSAAGSMEREHDAILRDFYLREKAEAAVRRLLVGFQCKGVGEERRRYISAVCAKGVYRLDTLTERAERVYAVTDKNGLGYLFMDTLYDGLRREGFSIVVCRSPLTDARKEAILLTESNVLFIVSRDGESVRADKIVNSARFADKDKMAEKRKRLRFIERCVAAVLDGAVFCFKDACALHAQAEKIYGTCVDFGRVEGIMRKIIDEIFENNV